MTLRMRTRMLGALAVLGLAAGMATATAGPALAVTCPTVDPSTGAVTPAPSPGVDWSGCDLSHAAMASADLAGAQLQNADLTYAYMPNADLAGASLSNANASEASMSGDDLANADLDMADLFGAMLDGANLRSADLEGATASASFTGAAMEDANLENANLDAAELDSANLFGANLQGITTDTNTFWGDATCPTGASAVYYVDGCGSAVAVTTPAATPVVTAGQVGNNGWYVSGVTVTWYWIDSNSLDSAKCAGTTSTTTQGSAVVIASTCTDSLGHVGNASVTVKIDTTPPALTITGLRKGGVYLLGLGPDAQCVTTDALSGVYLNAVTTTLGGRPDGTGVLTVTCSDAEDNAGNKAPTLAEKYTVLYAFGGFISPKVGSKLNAAKRQIAVRFRLTDATGKTIPAATAAALAAVYDVRASLRGPDTKPVVSSCGWSSKAKYFQCTITRPRHIRTGKSHKYSITVTENLGGGFLTVPDDPFSQNPESVFFG
ncbi:MAG: pentapeptide repeat-containing protein [Streptosporangiaceae bacterium]